MRRGQCYLTIQRFPNVCSLMSIVSVCHHSSLIVAPGLRHLFSNVSVRHSLIIIPFDLLEIVEASWKLLESAMLLLWCCRVLNLTITSY
ncbi:protein WAX2-like protein [Corchorus olitorius]|uniref:Protein WAX2-like protein n=1 Tax=Corchorus olitorius TaxID=93759 RepID=A0A1R3HDW8_9ROSI|nr:protein WAX2-like protein [Corchorus olitorius]